MATDDPNTNLDTDTTLPETPPEEEARPVNPLVLLLAAGILIGGLMALLTLNGTTLVEGATGNTAANIPTPMPDLVRPGSPAPDFALVNLEGETVQLSDYQGNVVAINFWATWCVPCRTEMPALQEASENYENLAILAVNNGESQEQVAAFMEDFGLTFPALLDRDFTVTDQYGVTALPKTVWVDEEGIVRFEHFGGLTESQIERYIVTVAQGQ